MILVFRNLMLMLVLASGISPLAAKAETRIALVVGNGSYSSVSSLANPARDANLIAETLKELGFEVTLLVDSSRANLRRGISQFGRDLRNAGRDATGLFYYAGHGVQSFGTNYLLPVDVNLTDAADLDLVAIEAASVLQQMNSAKNQTNIMILDACRNNPFDNIPTFNDSGLAEMKAPTGTFLAYATAPGEVALDGQRDNSPFTRALAGEMTAPGVLVEQVFKKVRVAVLKETGGQQTPWDTSSLTSDFIFAAGKIEISVADNSKPTVAITRARSGTPLSNVRNWMFQIQELNEDGAVQSLAATEYDMLVIEAGHNFSESPYESQQIVSSLREKPDGKPRVLLAYIDIGEAEDYRSYWQDGWIAPKDGSRGFPHFLVATDPDGWEGNYPVAYWDDAWQSLWLGSDGIVADLARLEFDGVYLDWIEAYDDDRVRAAAEKAGVSPEDAMISFVEKLGEAGRAINPDFLIVAQNAIYLIDADPDRYAKAIDALAVEDTWFHGWGDSDWDDPDGGDQRDRYEAEYSTSARLAQILRYQKAGLPVFSADYSLKKDNAAKVYSEAQNRGFIPLVTRVSLSKLTETPPPNLLSD